MSLVSYGSILLPVLQRGGSAAWPQTLLSTISFSSYSLPLQQ